MRRALLLLPLLAAPAAAAASPNCEASWQDAYARDWGYPKDQWLGDCRADIDPAAGLRRAQSDFMSACKDRFHRPEAGPASVQAEIYCALGKPGRAKLYALSGLPDPDRPAPAAPGAAAAAPDAAGLVPPPGSGGIGPLKRSLGVAREKWQPDACFSGLDYAYASTPFTTDGEWQRARRANEDPSYSMTFVEEFDYAFHSEAVRRGGYRVAFGDRIDDAACTDLRREMGPDLNGFPYDPFFASCLTSVRLDPRQALAVVFAKPVPVRSVRALLGTMSAGFLAGDYCSVIHDDGDTSRHCKDAPGWDARALKRTLGREVWAVTINDRTDFVDAGTGERLGWARGRLLPLFSYAGLWANPCPVPRLRVR